MLDRIQDLWVDHGGGFYAAGVVGTFVVLEVVDLVGEVRDLLGARSVIDALFDSVFSFALSTVMNTLQAAIWPLTWANEFGMTTALMAGGGLWLAWRGSSALLERVGATDRLEGPERRAPDRPPGRLAPDDAARHEA